MFGQIIATLPFYIRAYFDIGRYSVNKSTIGRPPKYRDYHEILANSSAAQPGQMSKFRFIRLFR